MITDYQDIEYGVDTKYEVSGPEDFQQEHHK